MRLTLPRYVCFAILLLPAMGFSGCGPSPDDPITLQSFSVTGTSASVQGVAPINPGVNNGQFSINWVVTGNVYTANVALNTGSIFDPITNILLATSCGKRSQIDNCQAAGTLNCTFDNSNVMQCSDGASSFAAQDLTQFLSGGVPMNAYMVIQACNPSGSVCQTASAPVQIQ